MSIFSQHLRRSSKAPASTRRLRRGGFTLIELLVVLAIMILITTVMLFQQKKFDSSTLLRSLAYSVALSMRQAQVYGVSVKESSAGSSNFNANYGIYFVTAPACAGTTGWCYQLFSDINNDGQYAVGEKVQEFDLNNGYSIKKFCATTSVGGVPTDRCSTDTLTTLIILFKRPNPDALISTNLVESYSSAYVQVQGPGGDTRSITVSSTGQILVGALGT